MQYGLIQGYAYYLVYGISMAAAGFITDKYKLNRVYVVAIGSGLTGIALVIEVSNLMRCSPACIHHEAATGQTFVCQWSHGPMAVDPCSEEGLPGLEDCNRAEDNLL
jgi:hypothetical protein